MKESTKEVLLFLLTGIAAVLVFSGYKIVHAIISSARQPEHRIGRYSRRAISRQRAPSSPSTRWTQYSSIWVCPMATDSL
jgi:hypothetical protein